MKMRLVLFLPLCITFVTSFQAVAQDMVGKTLPEVEVFTLVDSQAVKANTLHTSGKPTMVIVWNSMMKPAKAELDSLHKVYPIWQEKYGFEVIAIASEYPKFKNTNLKKFLPNRSYTYRIYYDATMRFTSATASHSMPTSFFLDKQGVIRAKMVGFEPSDLAKYEAQLMELSR